MTATESSIQIQANNANRGSADKKTSGFRDDQNHFKVREFISSAVYVETTYKLNSCNQTMYFPGSGDHPKTVTVKRCVCFTNPAECPCHPKPPTEQISQAEAEGYGVPPPNGINEPLSMTKMKEMLKEVCDESNDTSKSLIPYNNDAAPHANSERAFESDSGITVKASNSTSDLRLSIPSLTSIDTVVCPDTYTRVQNYREWCRRKDSEKKLQEEREQLIQKIKEQQKQAVVELERENFKRWLANKKKKEEEEKTLKLQQAEDKRRLEEEKSKRLSEADRNFQMWVRRKDKHELEKKIKRQLTLIEREEERQRRMEINQKAYEQWREGAKGRQKPVPFGRGIDTLRSSASVSYINPQPWVPNIEILDKPHSQ